MKLESYERMKALQDRLTDTVLVEADPESWPGQGKQLAELTQQERGDRYWCKRNAAATLSIIMRIHNLIGVVEQRGSLRPNEAGAEEGESDLEAEVRQAEKEAAAILAKMQTKARARQ